jgi:hypothetical protein
MANLTKSSASNNGGGWPHQAAVKPWQIPGRGRRLASGYKSDFNMTES